MLALPVALVAAGLLAFAGGASARGGQSQALAVSVDGNGIVGGSGISCRETTGDCVEIYSNGTSVTLTATPDPGATFSGWGGDCTGTASTCTLTMNSAKAVTATFTAGGGNPALTVTATGNGTVTGPGISCGGSSTDCTETYTPGTVVSLSESPSAGASFTGWGGACSGTSITCTVTMSASQAVTAAFSGGSGTTTNLTVSVTGNGKVIGPGISCGAGSTDCTETYTTGSSVALTASPSTGASFTGWGGSCSGTGTTCVVQMTASKTVAAAFTTGTTAQSTLTVTVTGNGRVTGPGITCGNGATDCSEVYANNASVTLIATPNAGATFTGWSGACSGATASCTVLMNASKNLTATFAGQVSTQRILTVTVGGPGRVTGPGIACGGSPSDCSQPYVNGQTVTLTAKPLTGAVFLGWGGACAGTGRTCTVRMDAPKAVSASFSTTGGRGGRSTGAFAVRSLGSPLVIRNAVGWGVTLRFWTNRAAAALLRLSLNGRLVNAFTFSPRAGNVLVGPFNVARAGNYRFALSLTDRAGATSNLAWRTCLSNRGGRECRGTFRPPTTSFVRSLGVTVSKRGSGWLVRTRFRASRAGTATVRMYRAGKLVSSGTFRFRAGKVVVDLPARRRGYHQVRLTARDTRGRASSLRWNVLIS